MKNLERFRFDTMLRRPWAAVALAVSIAMLVFVGAYVTLGSIEASATQRAESAANPEARRRGLAALDSVAARVASGKVAVSVPAATQEVLASEIRPGDRIDVIASVPGNDAEPALSAVVAHGATVLLRAQAGPGETLLLEVTPEEGLALGHLVLGGVRLSYALWSRAGPPAAAAPMNAAAARATLALPR